MRAKRRILIIAVVLSVSGQCGAQIIYDGEGGIPGLCWELIDPVSSNFSLYEFADRLRARGWLVPAYSMPSNREDLVIQRILVRHGFTKAMADQLLKEMRIVLQQFAQSPPRESAAMSPTAPKSISHDHSGR